MEIWSRIERFFKHNQLRFLEKLLGVPKYGPHDIDLNSIKKILVVRQHDQLGDFLLSTPVFKALRRQFPKAYIAVVARNYTASLIRHDQYIDQVLVFYENGKNWNLRKFYTFIKLLRQKYDLTIVLNTVSHSLTSDLLARFSGARYILGTDHLRFKGTNRNFFYHLEAPVIPGERNQGQRNLDIIGYLGIDQVDPYEHVTLLPDEKEWGRKALIELGWDGNQPLIAIHPGAGKLKNRWPVASFATAGKELAKEFDARLLVTWGPNEEELGMSLCDQLPGDTLSIVLPDIRKFASVLSCATLFLCNDTGVMHVASAIDLSLVVAFGPTNPTEWKPFGNKFVALQGKDSICDNVGPKMVINAAKNLLS